MFLFKTYLQKNDSFTVKFIFEAENLQKNMNIEPHQNLLILMKKYVINLNVKNFLRYLEQQ